MMRICRLAAADQARLRRHKSQMSLVAVAARLTNGEDALVDAIGQAPHLPFSRCIIDRASRAARTATWCCILARSRTGAVRVPMHQQRPKRLLHSTRVGDTERILHYQR